VEETNEFLRWEELTKPGRSQLILMMLYLERFEAGLSLFRDAFDRDPRPPHEAELFANDCVIERFDSLFTSDANLGVLPVLRQTGWGGYADLIETVLATAVGDTTLRGVLRIWRNKAIIHPTFNVGLVIREMNVALLSEPGHVASYRAAMAQLKYLTLDLLAKLRLRYPEVASILKDTATLPESPGVEGR
jgi:hypothetical protein